MCDGKTPRGDRHPVETDQFTDHIEVFCRLQDGVTVALDDVFTSGFFSKSQALLAALDGLYPACIAAARPLPPQAMYAWAK